jgi:hypothetical protein
MNSYPVVEPPTVSASFLSMQHAEWFADGIVGCCCWSPTQRMAIHSPVPFQFLSTTQNHGFGMRSRSTAGMKTSCCCFQGAKFKRSPPSYRLSRHSLSLLPKFTCSHISSQNGTIETVAGKVCTKTSGPPRQRRSMLWKIAKLAGTKDKEKHCGDAAAVTTYRVRTYARSLQDRNRWLVDLSIWGGGTFYRGKVIETTTMGWPNSASPRWRK